MIIKDDAGREILELHIWIAFVFNPNTGEPLTIYYGKRKAELEARWMEHRSFFNPPIDIRYTLASIREMR